MKADVVSHPVYTMPAVDQDMSFVEKLISVNVVGPMRMVHHFHRQIIAAKGTILNIGSIAGIVPHTFRAAYNASKAALHQYGNTLRIEMMPFGYEASSSSFPFPREAIL